MRIFTMSRPRPKAVSELEVRGWIRREYQAGGDYEAFIRKQGQGLLLVDFALGRFILDLYGDKKITFTESDPEGDNIPEYVQVLNALYVGEVNPRLRILSTTKEV
jgi:hypothetical protein